MTNIYISLSKSDVVMLAIIVQEHRESRMRSPDYPVNRWDAQVEYLHDLFSSYANQITPNVNQITPSLP